ncbi:MAG: glycosyltransferase [Candidatus Altiarchaeales archaeon]|nr:glycosyltransferase [Candidatus Altiarchaeales archaeon]MBD3416559.1 glycosyltransferase [Candidatus Altiarchaeales archaeon]
MDGYTVLIPVYNEEDILEDNIRKLMEYLDDHMPGYRIIVCSNGSTDRTDEIGSGIDDPRVSFISIPERGVGRAFKRMVLEAETDKLVSIDVDLTSDLRFIPECVRLLDENSIVIGSKRKGEQERQPHRTLISNVFIKLVKVLLGLKYSDYSIGTKGWRKSAISEYVGGIDHGSSYVIELTYYVEVGGGVIAEVPVFCSDTRGSKFNIVNEIFYRLYNLLRLWARVKLVRGRRTS